MSPSLSRIGAVGIAALALAAAAFAPVRGGGAAADPLQTPEATASATPTPLVVGSVRLTEGRRFCPEPSIELVGAFTATSAVAPVTEMRSLVGIYSSCSGIEDRIGQARWESFVPTRTYTIEVAAHLYSASLIAQYRDADGNVSSVYCDDIFGPACLGTQVPPPTATPPHLYAPLVVRRARVP